jgi:acyl transferase domain-containing protein
MSGSSEKIDYESRLKRAMQMLQQMRSKLEVYERTGKEPLAVVGMACRFPGGAHSPDAFWELMQRGTDAIRRVPEDRWDADAYYDPDPDAPGKMVTRYGGFLDTVDRFDPQFFGITPREAQSMDPQQLLLLEVTWEALENALIAPERLMGTKTGVFMGMAGHDHSLLQMRYGDPDLIDAYFATGNAASAAAGRLSYTLGLRGPNLAVDTACSSSLVAVHLACQSLRAGECDVALAGAVNVILVPEVTVNFSKARMIAPDGRCKTFDASANGFIRGEGCGVVVLKRLSDAVADGDTVYALIRGSAVNQDGRSSGLTVPNGPAQQDVIRDALANAGVDPLEVGYVEAHGTGTSLGDPIEVNALAEVLGKGRPADRRLRIGSVKTNLGHLEAAAGLAGLIKTILSLHHQELPPHLHFTSPSPHIPWARIPIEVPTVRTPWPRGSTKRIAGVSSFGFSGTNAHVILEEAPEPQAPAAALEPAAHVLTLSAKTEQALEGLFSRYAQHLSQPTQASLAELCHSARVGRAHLPHRASVVATSREQMTARLAQLAAGERPAGAHVGATAGGAVRSKVAFLFTGQGSQYVGMGRRLYETQPVFRDALQRCDALLRPMLDRPLLSILYPEAGQDSVLDETAYTQPALFALGYALSELWRSLGIVPSVVVGHSVGEYTAACVAGLFSLEDGLRLITERGRLMQALPGQGAMAAVFADEARVARAIAPHAKSISIAAINGPSETVISGEHAALLSLVEGFRAEGLRVQELKVSHAFHSPQMDSILDRFEQVARSVSFSPPRCPLISSVSGQLAGTEMSEPGYWRRQVREPVRFSAALRSMEAQGPLLFVEIGPSPVLLGMAARCLPEQAQRASLPSLRRDRDDREQFLESLGGLYVHGAAVDWSGLDEGAPRRRVPLPNYPFSNQPYRASRPVAGVRKPMPRGDTSPAEASRSDWLHEVAWRALPTGAGTPPRGHWVLFADRGGVAVRLSERLTAGGHSCTLVHPDNGWDDTNPREVRIDPTSSEQVTRLLRAASAGPNPFRGIVHLWSLDAGEPTRADALLAAQERLCGSTLLIVQGLATLETASPPRLHLVTRGARATGLEGAAPAQAPLWGLGSVIRLERPELRCINVDLEPVAGPDDASALLDVLGATDTEEQIALRQGGRQVPRLVRAAPVTSAPLTIRSSATYLITGGLGGLGLVMARWLVERGARHLVLLGRGAPSGDTLAVIQALEGTGARVRVLQADVAREEDVRRAFAEVRDTMPALAGVVHSAGVLRDGLLEGQRWADFAEVMAPKLAGALHLHELTRELPLDFFALFSSAWSLLGSPGQGSYVAANTYLDALAHHRRALGLPAVSIHWGPWADVGMSARVKGDARSRLQAFGVGTLSAESVAPLLDRLLSASSPEVVVLPVHWPRFLEQFAPGGAPRLLAEVTQEAAPTGAETPSRSEFLDRLMRAPSSAQRELLAAHLQHEVARVMRLEPPALPGRNHRLFDLGLDSLMAVELKNRLQASLGRPLPVSTLFNYPTIEALTEHLAGQFVSAAPPAEVQPTEVAPQAPEPDAAALEDVEQLSEDELDSMLLQLANKHLKEGPLTR